MAQGQGQCLEAGAPHPPDWLVQERIGVLMVDLAVLLLLLQLHLLLLQLLRLVDPPVLAVLLYHPASYQLHAQGRARLMVEPMLLQGAQDRPLPPGGTRPCPSQHQ